MQQNCAFLNDLIIVRHILVAVQCNPSELKNFIIKNQQNICNKIPNGLTLNAQYLPGACDRRGIFPPGELAVMMVYLAAFAFFLLFVGALALSFVFKRRAILSEDEAHAIMEGMTCATCTTACINAGRGLDLHGTERCAIDNPRIAHKNI